MHNVSIQNFPLSLSFSSLPVIKLQRNFRVGRMILVGWRVRMKNEDKKHMYLKQNTHTQKDKGVVERGKKGEILFNIQNTAYRV